MPRLNRSMHSVNESMKPLPQRRKEDQELVSMFRGWFWADTAILSGVAICFAGLVYLIFN
jgi:hypothetical protein